MRPPKGFDENKNPLRHILKHSFGLSMGDDTLNTALLPIVMHSLDMDVEANTIQVNPHNDSYEEDLGPLVRKNSIIDRLRISLKFTMTSVNGPAHHVSGISGSEVFLGDDIPVFNFLWRPIFNVYPEKLDAADEDTGTTVAAILGLTKDATNEDIVPVTTNNLPVGGPAETDLPISTVNAVQVLTDYNMTSDMKMEDHVFDEDLLHSALRRYTNKGALRSCLGRTRHVTLTRNKPYMNFFIDKPVPLAIRRVQAYSFFGIQIHVPIDTHNSQYFATASASIDSHLGVKMISNYHEWNNEHDQDRLVT